MEGRIVLVACLLALAGCPGGPGAGPAPGGADPTPTVTPVPEPTPEAPLPAWADVPDAALDPETVNGTALASAHVSETGPAYTRTVSLRIEAENGSLLVYEANRTRTGTEFLTDRRYRGPETARFVPGVADARNASEQLYDDGSGGELRQVVDGRPLTDGAADRPRFEPALRVHHRGYVETALDDVPLRGRTPSGDVVASVERGGTPLAVVPRYLSDPRDVGIEARVSPAGEVSRVTLVYRASLDGRAVTVEQTVRWGPPEGDVEPSWVDDRGAETATPTPGGGS